MPPIEDFDPPLPPNYSFSGDFGTQASIPNVFVTPVQSTVTIPDITQRTPIPTDLIIIQDGLNTYTTQLINVINLVPGVANGKVGLTINANLALTSVAINYFILAANALTVTLPDITSLPTNQYFTPMTFLLNTGTVGTINTFSGSQFISGSLTTYSLSAAYKYVTLITDGTGWYIVGNN